MDFAVLGFLVRLQPSNNVLPSHFEFGQTGKRERRFRDSRCLLVIQSPDHRRNARRGNHSPRHRLSVQ